MTEPSDADRDLRARLQRREVTDDCLDELYPDDVRQVSRHFWTPVDVAFRVADRFEASHAERILDVGSGPGKLALVAGAVVPDLDVTGIEHRPALVEVARRSAERLRLPNVRFFVGNVVAADWAAFDGFYFFNPFGENLFGGEDRFDRTVELSRRRFLDEVLLVERALRSARIGTTVITYHGFGGRIPRSFELWREEVAGSGLLRTWHKAREGRADEGHWVDGPGGRIDVSFNDELADYESVT